MFAKEDKIISSLNNDDKKVSSIDLYLKDISKEKLLTAEEEVELFKRLKDGDESAREQIIKSNLRLVVSIAKKYKTKEEIDFLDLIQDGNIGLTRAVEAFDYTKGNKFSTYATWWIKQGISRGLIDNGKLIRIPVHIKDKQAKIYKASAELFAKNGTEPSANEIYELLKDEFDFEEFTSLMNVVTDTISIDEAIGDDGTTSLSDLIKDENIDTPLKYVNRLFMEKLVEKVISSLNDKEQLVIKMKFGFYDGKTYTLNEIGEKLGVTKERVRQIEEKVLEKLKNSELKEYSK